MKSYLAYQSVTIPANDNRVVNVTGSMFVCKFSSFPFTMNVDGGDDFAIEQGWSFRLQGSDTFRFLHLKNPLAKPLTITFYAGSSQMSFVASNQLQSAATYPKGTELSLNSAVNGGKAQFTGSDNGGNVRKQIVVTNLSTTTDIEIHAANADGSMGPRVGQVFPRSAWTLETSASLYVVNVVAANISVIVGETFYA